MVELALELGTLGWDVDILKSVLTAMSNADPMKTCIY